MKTEKKPVRIEIDKGVAASLAKVIVLAGLRNTILEDIHAGTWPVSILGKQRMHFSDFPVFQL